MELCISRFLSENISYVNLENWDRNTPSTSPRAFGTKLALGKERIHREVLSKSVRLMSVVLARRNSRKDHTKRYCAKKDAPAKQRGIWRKTFSGSRIRTEQRLFSSIEAMVMRAPTSTRPEEREFVVGSGASVHMMSKKRIKLRRDEHSEKVQNLHPLRYSLQLEKCTPTRRHKFSFMT